MNLLPWRAAQREIEKKQFCYCLMLSLIAAICIIWMLHLLNAYRLENYLNQNRLLNQQLSHLKTRYQQVIELQQLQQKLTVQIAKLNSLQNSHFLDAQLFNLLTQIIPDGVFLTRLNNVDNNLLLIGQAKSSLQVAELMRNIENTKQFDSPVLHEIKNMLPGSSYQYQFKVEIKY